MTPEEARLILGAYRPGKDDAEDPFFREALQLAREDAALAEWFAAEQAFDARIAASLGEGEAPAGLKAALLTIVEPPAPSRWTPARAFGLAALAAAVAVLLTLQLAPRQATGGSLEDFRTEMTSFLALDPPLALQTPELTQIRAYLQPSAGAVEVPGKTAQLPAVGCRTLVFRGYPVGLLCFRREDGKLAHLLVIDRNAFAAAELPAARELKERGEWASAAWQQGGQVYVLATKGSREQLERLL